MNRIGVRECISDKWIVGQLLFTVDLRFQVFNVLAFSNSSIARVIFFLKERNVEKVNVSIYSIMF